jgi:hypothetical protein
MAQNTAADPMSLARGEQVPFLTDPVDRGLDRRVERLDDQHQHETAQQQRPLHARGTEPQPERRQQKAIASCAKTGSRNAAAKPWNE